MDYKINQEFNGNINNIQFNDKDNFYATLFVLEQIHNKWDEIFNDKFINDLSDAIEIMYLKYDSFSYSEVENEFSDCVDKANNFNDIKFTYYGSDWKIESLNESIAKGEYNKIKEQNLNI